MKKNKIHIFILAGLLLNLLISANLSQAFSTTSDISIANCPITTIGCLIMATPANLSVFSTDLNQTQFFDNDQKDVYFNSLYDLPGGKVIINNSIENGNFELSVKASSSVKSDDPTLQVPYSQIGLASFNNNSDEGSIHASRIATNTPIESNIDPVYNGKTTDPTFNQTTIHDHLVNGDNLEDYYTYFSGSGPDSDSIEIIPPTPHDHNSTGYFNFGLSAIIKIPAGSVDGGLIDGTYNSTLTFTLTTT